MEMLRLALVVIFHPADAFYLIKRNRGRDFLAPSIVLMALLAVTRVLHIYLMNYTVSRWNLRQVNLVNEIAVYLWVLLSWAIAVYAVSSVMSGSIFFKEGLFGTALAAMPLIVLQVPIAMASWVMSANEAVFLNYFNLLMWVWVIALAFRGVMVMNDYSFGKTVAVVLVSLVFIAVFWCVLVMLLIFTSNLIEFVNGLLREFAGS